MDDLIINPSESIDISPISKKINIIMDSQVLTSLMSCGRLTDFRFNHRLQSINGKSPFFECGSIVHTYLEYYYRNVINGMSPEKSFAYAITAAELYIAGCPTCTDFHTHRCVCSNIDTEGIYISDESCLKCNGSGIIKKPLCGHSVNAFPGVRNVPKESEGAKIGWAWVLDTCDQYYRFYRNDHWVPLEIEIVKGQILYEDDEIRVLWKAKLDATFDTNQGIYPVDHKTMKQRRKTNSMNNQFMGQCLIMKTQNVIINKIGFQTTLKPEEKFERKPVSYSSERLVEWQTETLPFYARQLMMYNEMEHFPPNFTNCENKFGNCAFLPVCEANQSMRESELKRLFKVGPEWNPVNEIDDVSDEVD